MNPVNESMDTRRIEHMFALHTGSEIAQLLDPIEQANPSGESLKSNGVYSAIKQARSADDPNLPLGVWEHDLKVADWEEVTELAVNALKDKSKDLQIMIWLLEAQIHRYGFAGIAPAFHLMQQITESFWADMHPQIEQGDLDYRTNLIAWLNEKLQPAIRQLEITQTRSDRQFNWADWEIAVKMELIADDNNNPEDYVGTRQIVNAVTATPIEFYRNLYRDVSDAIITVDAYSKLLDEKCQQDSPSLEGFRTLLLEIRETLVVQVRPRIMTASNEDDDEPEAESAEPSLISSDMPGGGSGGGAVIDSRDRAYAQLAEAAAYLMQDDPHSPVPYLVYKAIEWGKLNTAELYQELFVQYQGQLNIFEMLGLEINDQ